MASSPSKKILYKILFNGRKPSYKNIHIWGCGVTVHKNHAKALALNGKPATFIGYGSTTAAVIYMDNHTSNMSRAHNCSINDFHFADPHCPGAVLLDRNVPLYQRALPPPTSKYDLIASPFNLQDLYTYTVRIPPTGSLGITWEDDDIFGIPIITKMHPNSPFCTGCRNKIHTAAWVVSIHQEEPITVARCVEYLAHLSDEGTLQFQVTLTKRITPRSTRYQ